MSEMTSVEQQQQQQQYVGSGSSNNEHHCKDCQVNFESANSLEVHVRYHRSNLLNHWASQAQQEESNNNNSKAGNHNSSHVGTKRDSVTAPADSSEPSSRPPSEPAPSQQQQQQQQAPSQQRTHHPTPGGEGYNHFQTPMFSETSFFMQNDSPYILSHHYSPGHEDAQQNNSSSVNYTRYHPYQHQQHFTGERANSVSSTSPRSPPLQCDKCGGVFDDANQLGEHVRSNHPTSPNSYPGQPQYQQIGGSPQQQQQQQQQQMHTSPPQNNQQAQQQQQHQPGYDYNGSQSSVKSEPKQEPEEQAEILDLDSHKVHRYEEELMRLHQQQELQMQMHQQQQQAMQHQQQQQQQAQQRGASHSVSSMLGWPAAQPHEYHPGMSPMGSMDSVSPIPDQGQFMRGQHIPVETPRHPGSPIITSTQPMPGHQLAPGLLQQPTKPPSIGNQSWKSNEARRPKTYNCTACNKWFTSSGHLKRHYNTTLHKNAVKQSNMPDPAHMPISAHHHPGRDANLGHSGRGGGGGSSRSPELSTSGSPPNLMAGPSGEAARGLLHTPTNLYTTSNSSNGSTNSNSSDSSAVVLTQQQQQQQQQSVASTVHMGSTMVGLNSPVPSPMGSHLHHQHHQQMGSPSPQLVQHQLSIGSPSQLVVHHPMSSPMSPMQPPPPPQHLNSPSPMGSHHLMTSPSPIMAGVPPMVSPPMGGTSMPHQPYPNALPPHVTTTTSIPVLLESITSQLTTTGNEIHHQQQQIQLSQDLLPGFGTFSNHQRPLPSFTQFGITGFLVSHNQPQAVNVGGLSPEEGIPQERSFDSTGSNYDPYTNSPPTYESLTSLEVAMSPQSTNIDGMIIKQYEVQQHHHDPRNQRHQHSRSHSNGEHAQIMETNNNLPQRQGKEEINPNIGKQQSRDEKKTAVITKEHHVTSTNTGSHYISQEGFHKCIECNKVFNKACYLTQHNKSFHSGDKPFKCNQCGKRFPLEYLHAEHLQKHAGEKPYKCEICPKQFNHKTDLRRHMCLHTGEKPYACDNCGKGFIRKDHMMKHLETHKKKPNNHHNIHLRA